ncbi:MAG: DUF2064 domain-containing protein [Fibrobacteres bacterium]|nr:DUF2064 domain-containing protein [Fibrobacterota bacterium]
MYRKPRIDKNCLHFARMTTPFDCTLVLLCKRPRLGEGKQRLAAGIGTDSALAIAELLLSTSVDLLLSWPGQKVIAPAKASDCSWAEQVASGCEVIAQGEGNLGQRIQGVDQFLREKATQRILWIGSDCPALTLEDLVQASRMLHANCDFYFQPALDGGAVLMGNAQPWPPLETLPWSTNQFLEATTQRCQGDGTVACGGETLPDLDLVEDLVPVAESLQIDSRKPQQALATKLRSMIGALPPAI